MSLFPGSAEAAAQLAALQAEMEMDIGIPSEHAIPDGVWDGDGGRVQGGAGAPAGGDTDTEGMGHGAGGREAEGVWAGGMGRAERMRDQSRSQRVERGEAAPSDFWRRKGMANSGSRQRDDMHE